MASYLSLLRVKDVDMHHHAQLMRLASVPQKDKQKISHSYNVSRYLKGYDEQK